MTSRSGESLSVIIVTFNCKDLVHRCLDSLGLAMAGIESRVLVVDNASEDGTASHLRAHFPDVEVIENSVNRGFGVACNQALSRLLPIGNVLFLNPDTEVTPNSLLMANDCLRVHPNAGAVGALLIQGDGTVDHACRRWFPSTSSAFEYFIQRATDTRASSAYASVEAAYTIEAPVDAINGAFMLVRRECLEDVGGFDEKYWMYGEDLDWCQRCWRAGWQVVFTPRATAVHLKGGTSGRRRRLRTNYWFHRSMWIYYRDYEWSAASAPFVALGLALRFVATVVQSGAHLRKFAAPDG
jgi:N-acetylglucosaminyl-diphospho-decaprenol L-rhamnosyltransferase